MHRYFVSPKELNSDCFVADYTDVEVDPRKVEFFLEHPGDIECFLLANPNNIPYWAINFEQEKSIFKNERGERVSNCECMFVSSRAKSKPWACLVEMKYCRNEKNIEVNAETAFDQLLKTYRWIKDKGVFDDQKYRVYLNISMPGYDSLEPFTSWKFTNDDYIKFKLDYGVILQAFNMLEIMTHTRIKERPLV